jgi:ribosomal-protein-alanine N-acetyltransferase
MSKESNISMELANGKKGEYIIRDRLRITIGRINIIDISKENKYCLARIKFYRYDYDGVQFLQETLKLYITSLFKNENIHKINIIVDEEISTRPFVSLGFTLEGIMTNSIYYNRIYKNEIVFGIDCNTNSSLNTVNILRLYGKNLILKILNVDDASDVLNYYIKNKEHLRRYEPIRDESFYSLEAQRQILVENYKQFLNGLGVCFGIYKDEKLIGKIQMSSIIFGVFKNGIVGYSMDKEYQGRGYMKETLKMLMEYAFDEMGLHRIEASTLVDNVRSQGVLRGCNFIELGLNKKYLFINGEWRDHITFYKIKEEL